MAREQGSHAHMMLKFRIFTVQTIVHNLETNLENVRILQ